MGPGNAGDDGPNARSLPLTPKHSPPDVVFPEPMSPTGPDHFPACITVHATGEANEWVLTALVNTKEKGVKLST